MSANSNHSNDTTEIREGDIVFECPDCGKSMAIEAAGAGLMVPCVTCNRQVQVPIPDANTPEVRIPGRASAPVIHPNGDPHETIRQLDAALAYANEQTDRLVAEKEALQERRAFLEQLRMAHTERLQQLANEVQQMQDTLDRIGILLTEIRTERPM